MKGVLFVIIGVLLSTFVSATCDVYVGDKLTLPQLTADKNVDGDTSDGILMYLHGAYEIGNTSENPHQLSSNVYPEPTVVYSFDEVGIVTYKAVITFAESKYDKLTSSWVISDSGIDKQIKKDFNVCAIPDPDENFLQKLLSSLISRICQAIPSFNFC